MNRHSWLAPLACSAAALVVTWSRPFTAEATAPDLSLRAHTYGTFSLVQAMDACTVTNSVNGGFAACTPGSNVATDGTPFKDGSILVRENAIPPTSYPTIRWRMRSNGGHFNGSLIGQTLHPRLVLRVSDMTGTFTFEDYTLDCPPALVLAPGDFDSGFFDLRNCISPNVLDNLVAFPGYNKEIRSAVIINDGSGKALAVPGVRQTDGDFADLAPAPDALLNAKGYKHTVVQAVDECVSGPLSLYSGAIDACNPQAYVISDGTHFRLGTVIMNSFGSIHWRLASSGAVDNHALAGKSIQLRLTVRSTRFDSLNPLPVTFPDATITCPCVVVPSPSGNVSQGTDLVTCGLPSPKSDATAVREIVSSEIVDCGTQKPIAVRGTRKFP